MPAMTMTTTAVRTDVLTTAEAARELNVPENTIRCWMQKDLIRSRPANDGSDRLIPMEEVEFLRSILPPF